jgi:hypothetical protein
MVPQNCNPPCETLVALIERVQNLDHAVNGNGNPGLKAGQANLNALVTQHGKNLENMFGRVNYMEIRLAKLIGWAAGAAAVGGMIGGALAISISSFLKMKGW